MPIVRGLLPSLLFWDQRNVKPPGGEAMTTNSRAMGVCRPDGITEMLIMFDPSVQRVPGDVTRM